MKVAVEEMESCKRRLVVEAPADVVTKEWERAYDRVQKQARLPGFRKGHVPRSNPATGTHLEALPRCLAAGTITTSVPFREGRS